jgi:hypothetical protein
MRPSKSIFLYLARERSSRFAREADECVRPYVRWAFVCLFSNRR